MSAARLGSVVNWPGAFSSVVALESSLALMRAVMDLASCCLVRVLVGGRGVGSAGLWSCWNWPLAYWWKRCWMICVIVLSFGFLVLWSPGCASMRRSKWRSSFHNRCVGGWSVLLCCGFASSVMMTDLRCMYWSVRLRGMWSSVVRWWSYRSS